MVLAVHNIQVVGHRVEERHNFGLLASLPHRGVSSLGFLCGGYQCIPLVHEYTQVCPLELIPVDVPLNHGEVVDQLDGTFEA